MNKRTLTAAYRAALASVDVASQALDAARQTVRAATDTRDALMAVVQDVRRQLVNFTSEHENEHE